MFLFGLYIVLNQLYYKNKYWTATLLTVSPKSQNNRFLPDGCDGYFFMEFMYPVANTMRSIIAARYSIKPPS